MARRRLKHSLVFMSFWLLRYVSAQWLRMRNGFKQTLKALLLILSGLSSLPALADAQAVEVQSLEVEATSEQQTLVEVRLILRLSEVATQAIWHGVPLSWRVIIQWRQQRRFWWDKVLLEKEIRLKLQYHALLNQFSIQRGKAEAEMFSTLDEALKQIGWLRLRLGQMERNAIRPAGCIAVKVAFERRALPSPLQPEAWLDKQWDLSSDWSLWPIQK